MYTWRDTERQSFLFLKDNLIQRLSMSQNIMREVWSSILLTNHQPCQATNIYRVNPGPGRELALKGNSGGPFRYQLSFNALPILLHDFPLIFSATFVNGNLAEAVPVVTQFSAGSLSPRGRVCFTSMYHLDSINILHLFVNQLPVTKRSTDDVQNHSNLQMEFSICFSSLGLSSQCPCGLHERWLMV